MHVVVLGAGLAGLAAAWELARAGVEVDVVEREAEVGGMAASWQVDGHWLDHGPHRFHTRDPELLAHVREVLGADLELRERRSRIRLRGRWFDYPLRAGNVLANLPPWLLARALYDYGRARLSERLRPTPDAHFEAWVVKRFGRTLYELFFGTYTAKAWRMPCDRISADWASQRIAQSSLGDTIVRTLFPSRDEAPRGLVAQFHYPRQGGIGSIARAYAEGIRAAGGRIHLGESLESVEVAEGRARRVHTRGARGPRTLGCDALVNTIPWTTLLARLRFADGSGLDAPTRAAMAGLSTIGIVFVYLEVERERVMPDHWVYLPEADLTVHRVSEFRNFCAGASPAGRTALCCEITCRPGDERWTLEPQAAAALAQADLVRVGLLAPGEGRLLDLRRLAHAYPVYDLEYRERVQALRRATRPVANLVTTGRQGLFRYNNMDHSIAMGRKAAHGLLVARELERVGAPAPARAHESVGAGAEFYG
jgi:protoporphyrinogen oxidase